MKAAVLHGKADVRLEEVPLRPLQPGEVRVQIEAALTCGTDLKVYKRGYHAKMIVPPAVFGHELAGIISEVSPPQGGEVCSAQRRPWAVGERVVAANSAPCGKCFYCRNQQENLCDDLLFLNGAYAESIVIPARLAEKNLLRLKPSTAFRDAALMEPLACAVQGVMETRLGPGQRVLVLGAGPIGLMFIVRARHLGCHVTVVGRGEKRLQAAARLGAEQVIPAKIHGDPAAALPRDAMFDVVIEAVGKPETWELATRLVRKGGRVNFFGGCPSGTQVSLDTSRIHYANLTLLASFHHTPRAIRRALELIENGVIRAVDFVDGECPLSDLPELFKSMAAGNRAVKTLIHVGK
jgi:L-iditol 2-dehydrogenase